ncbi:hypothetical protein C4D60_Mb02t19080 [Musa balbisiana]|uniref:Uncharacterized protein n=1 Tax=Musa balbisiana TaxID=52838 RepID=A0A4S8IBS0_MUSBA|nr:hypothetical protein C4D60_Mb02t19080 [Musa balbisiana]
MGKRKARETSMMHLDVLWCGLKFGWLGGAVLSRIHGGERKQKRMLSNRESAQRSQRKKQ